MNEDKSVIRQILIILLGIVPASVLSLFAIGLAVVGAAQIIEGYPLGWIDLITSVFALVGTAALFAVVLFSMTLATKIGLILGSIAALRALLLGHSAGVQDLATLAVFPLTVALYILLEDWIKRHRPKRDN